VELHAVWLLQPVRLPLSVTVIGICLVQPKPGTIVGTQNCRWLLQPVNRCCSHCNEIQGETTICLAQSLVLKIAASWAAVPAGCANEFQTMLWGCSSRHSKDHAVGLFQPTFHVYLNAGWLFQPATTYPFLLELEGGGRSLSRDAVSPKKGCSQKLREVFVPKCC
jgi:hypothetical protein